MKKTLFALLAPGLLVLFAPAVYAHDDDDCGKSADHLKKELKGKSGSDSELEKNIQEHMRLHPDGKCHCMCGHKKTANKAEGEKKKCERKKEEGDKKGEGDKKCERPKKSEGENEERCRRERAKKTEEARKKHEGEKEHCRPKPPPPPKKKCCCDGDKDEGTAGGKGKGPKGNNGVGNGEDPQPPGNPPKNDGSDTGPGNPGNKGHGKGHK